MSLFLVNIPIFSQLVGLNMQSNVPINLLQLSPEQPVRSETSVTWVSIGGSVLATAVMVVGTVVNSVSQQCVKQMCFVGVHQVALLTQLDKVCQETDCDITQV